MRISTYVVLSCLAAALGLSACQPKSGDDDKKAAGKTLTIYSSLPLHGPEAARSKSIVNGAKLALEQHDGKAGNFKIEYEPLDDSDPAEGESSDGVTPEQASENARKAKDDDSTIGYIGELDSDGTAISLPLLNDAGIPQVSPSNGAVGLTTSLDGAARGEPDKYYPEEVRTYVRVVPNDSVQAAALVKLMQKEGCRAVAVFNDGSVDALSVARAFEAQAKAAKLEIALEDGVDPRDDNYEDQAEQVTKERPDCILLAAENRQEFEHNASRAMSALAAAAPSAKLFANSALADPSFTDPADGGVSAAIAGRTLLTLPPLGAKNYPDAGREFFADYEKEYGEAPDPYAIYGYESMNLLLDSIADAGKEGNDRETVTAKLRATKDRKGAVGTYSIDRNGDTSIVDYGVYKVEDGKLVFDRKVEAEPAKPPAESRGANSSGG